MAPAHADCSRFQGADAPQSSRVHLRTFYTEGPPFDQGKNLSASAASMRERMAPHFASFHAWTRSEVAALRPDLVSVGNDAPRENKGYETIGYGAFKPWLMLEAFKTMEPGDIVVLHDVDVLHYRGYARSADELPGVSRWVMNTVGADVWMPMENPWSKGELTLGRFCKPMLVRELGARYFPTHEIFASAEQAAKKALAAGLPASRAAFLEAEFAHVHAQASPAQQRRMAALAAFPLLQAHIVVARNTPAAVRFLTEWLAFNRPEYVSIVPNRARGVVFHHHTCEQASFTLLAAMKVLDGELPPDYPRYSFGYFSRIVSCGNAWRLNSTLALMMDNGRCGRGRFARGTYLNSAAFSAC